MSDLVLYPYYGGKNRQHMRDFIISKFPIDYQDRHYIETHFGSGGIFFGKKPSVLETINDLDLNIDCFLRVLRTQKERFIEVLKYTAWSQAEFERSRVPQAYVSDLEQARLFYILVRQGFNSATMGNSQTWKFSSSTASNSPKCPKSWKRAVATLDDVATRLTDAQIAGPMDGIELLEKFDIPEALVYMDPPYIHDARSSADRHGYRYECNDKWHRELAKRLLTFKGKVVLSGYQHGIYKRLEKAGWLRFDLEVFASANRSRVKRTESIWLNYEPPAQQLSIFGGNYAT